MSAYTNYTITVEKGYHAGERGHESHPSPGVRAKFRRTAGSPHAIFDSVASQRQLGWTDTTRRKVEQAVLTHRRFGRGNRGIHLAPGQEVPPEHQHLFEGQQTPEAPAAPSESAEPLACATFSTDSTGAVTQCDRPAVDPTSMLCAVHGGAQAPDAPPAPVDPESLPDGDGYCAELVGEDEDERLCRRKAKTGESYCGQHLKARAEAEEVSA